jgi:Raf kinase inhibitor-like YbhB/YbcL family protein
MRLLSDAFSTNGTIPSRYTCDGDNISPPLKWNDVPAETQSLALIVDDPDAPGGTFVHWVVYDISPNTREMPEAIPTGQSTLSGSAVQGKNSFETIGYGGPCPPEGMHHYVFKLYALDCALGLPTESKKADVEAAIEGHILAQSELVGHYERTGAFKQQKSKVQQS